VETHHLGKGVVVLCFVFSLTSNHWSPRQGFRLFWKRKSKAKSAQAKVEAQTIALIKEMASNNRLWGAERIRGELLKLGIRVCKRTIQKYMRAVRTPRSKGQKWATFLRNHAGEIWACDFLQVTGLLFRSFFAFFNTLLKSRKVIHVGVTRAPTDAWTARTAAGSDSVWTHAEVSHRRS
jgi:putative transposase